MTSQVIPFSRYSVWKKRRAPIIESPLSTRDDNQGPWEFPRWYDLSEVSKATLSPGCNSYSRIMRGPAPSIRFLHRERQEGIPYPVRGRVRVARCRKASALNKSGRENKNKHRHNKDEYEDARDSRVIGFFMLLMSYSRLMRAKRFTVPCCSATNLISFGFGDYFPNLHPSGIGLISWVL